MKKAFGCLMILVACGGDGGGGSAPTTATAPAPAPAPPSLPLAFLDVPEEPVMLDVGESQTLGVRVSPPVVARCAASAADEDKVEVSADSILCEGAFEFVLTGLEPGETEVGLEAEAEGYREAAATLDVVILRGAEIHTRRNVEWTFRDRRNLDAYVELRILSQEGKLGLEEFNDLLFELASSIHPNDYGWFVDEDPISWDEETEATAQVVLAGIPPYRVPLIRVWGVPFFDDDGRFEDRSQWWVMKQFTSFGKGGRNIEH